MDSSIPFTFALFIYSDDLEQFNDQQAALFFSDEQFDNKSDAADDRGHAEAG